jgi:hypothetical protein
MGVEDAFMWNRETGQFVCRLVGHAKGVRGFTLHPVDTCQFTSYSDDGSFIVWKMPESERIPVEEAQPEPETVNKNARRRTRRARHESEDEEEPVPQERVEEKVQGEIPMQDQGDDENMGNSGGDQGDMGEISVDHDDASHDASMPASQANDSISIPPSRSTLYSVCMTWIVSQGASMPAPEADKVIIMPPPSTSTSGGLTWIVIMPPAYSIPTNTSAPGGAAPGSGGPRPVPLPDHSTPPLPVPTPHKPPRKAVTRPPPPPKADTMPPRYSTSKPQTGIPAAAPPPPKLSRISGPPIPITVVPEKKKKVSTKVPALDSSASLPKAEGKHSGISAGPALSLPNQSILIPPRKPISPISPSTRFNPFLLEPKQVLADEFRIDSYVGHSGFSIIWAAQMTDIGDTVALKFYKQKELYDREIRFLKMFKHPNILELVDAFETDQDSEWYPFHLTILPLGKQSMQDVFQFSRPLLTVHLKSIVYTMVEILQTLQTSKVVHCDLKPANFVSFGLVNGFLQWKVIDFDSACLVNEPVERGTLDFCAPEVFAAFKANHVPPAKFSMDMYSLGRIIQWFVCENDNTWPNLDRNPSDEDKEAFLLSGKEFDLASVHDVSVKGIVAKLIRKEVKDRWTLKKLQESSFIAADRAMDTKCSIS